MPKAKRYGQILGLIEQVKPKTIIEIGVWNGGRACEMALAALAHSDRVHYIGYDLFEDATDETNQTELNAKQNCTVEEVTRRLFEFQKANPGFTFTLCKGNTRETLICHNADFVYIDGGHSVETIRNDYEYLKTCPCVVFDDYYIGLTQEQLERVGANQVVDPLFDDPQLACEIIDTGDPLSMGEVKGVVALAVVRRSPRTKIALGGLDPETEGLELADDEVEPVMKYLRGGSV